MKGINWISYYYDFDGYGRFSSRIVKALLRLTNIQHFTMDDRDSPAWMQQRKGLNWDNLTISFMQPYCVKPVPGQHWLYSMTEGSRLLPKWVEQINSSGVERILVPCEHNKQAFEASGVQAPVHVVPGGTDALEFPYTGRQERSVTRRQDCPYTFLTIADRGFRKGWEEVWKAFYLAFGGKTSGRQDVKLVIKARPRRLNSTLGFMMNAGERDQRIVYDISDKVSLLPLYQQADCLALPSRSEGWGMPHREGVLTGLPLLTQHYSGLAEPLANLWSLDIPGTVKPIPKGDAAALGDWRIADVPTLAQAMQDCADNPQRYADFGLNAALWLTRTQTWMHAAQGLLDTVNKYA